MSGWFWVLIVSMCCDGKALLQVEMASEETCKKALEQLSEVKVGFNNVYRYTSFCLNRQTGDVVRPEK